MKRKKQIKEMAEWYRKEAIKETRAYVKELYNNKAEALEWVIK